MINFNIIILMAIIIKCYINVRMMTTILSNSRTCLFVDCESFLSPVVRLPHE